METSSLMSVIASSNETPPYQHGSLLLLLLFFKVEVVVVMVEITVYVSEALVFLQSDGPSYELA